MRPPRPALAVVIAVVVLDALSKAIVAALLVPGRVVHVSSWLALDLYYNHAGARNALTGRPVVVSLLAGLSVLALALLLTRTRSRGFAVGLGLLLGGGIGNLADRLFGAPGPLRGGVIDWLAPFGSSGSMNLADLAINLGLLVLALSGLWHWWRRPRATEEPADSVGAPA